MFVCYKIPVSRLCLCREASGLQCIFRQVYCLQARLNESQPDLDAAILIGVEPRVTSSCLVREIRIAPVPDWQAFLSGFAESVVGETEGEGAMLFAFLCPALSDHCGCLIVASRLLLPTL